MKTLLWPRRVLAVLATPAAAESRYDRKLEQAVHGYRREEDGRHPRWLFLRREA